MSAWTERDVASALKGYYSRLNGNGNGPRYVFARQVRNRAGFDATRTFDAVAVDLWPSQGLPIHAFEIKVTRSDWLRELKQPEKGADALRVADTMSVVALAGIVVRAEVPDGWGWYEVSDVDGRLRVRCRLKPKPITQFGAPLGRSFAVALLRAAVYTAETDGTR